MHNKRTTETRRMGSPNLENEAAKRVVLLSVSIRSTGIRPNTEAQRDYRKIMARFGVFSLCAV
jgi:hypothetical protein